MTSSEIFGRETFYVLKISENGRSEAVAWSAINQDFAEEGGLKPKVKK